MAKWIISSVMLCIIFGLALFYYYGGEIYKGIFWAIMSVAAVIMYSNINIDNKK